MITKRDKFALEIFKTLMKNEANKTIFNYQCHISNAVELADELIQGLKQEAKEEEKINQSSYCLPQTGSYQIGELVKVNHPETKEVLNCVIREVLIDNSLFRVSEEESADSFLIYKYNILGVIQT